MAGLQRSQMSFRRQGSSGMVWDDKFLKKLTEENPQPSPPPATPDNNNDDDAKRESSQKAHHDQVAVASHQKGRGVEELKRSKSTTAGLRAVKVSDADQEPPSPRVTGCGFCGVFGKTKTASKKKNKKNSTPANKKAGDGKKSYEAAGGRKESTKNV